MSAFGDLTELCLYGMLTGFGFSFILWGIGLGPRIIRIVAGRFR